MLICVLALFALAALAPGLHRLAPRLSSWTLALGVAAVCAWIASRAPAVLGGEVPRESYAWVPALGVRLELALDGLSLLFALLVTGMGALVLLYGRGYLGPGVGLGRFQGLLLAFMGAMLGMVLAADLVLFFVFWELTSVSSYLLIGFKHEKAEARAAARRALLVTGAGGLALMLGLLLLGAAGGSFQMAELAGAGARIREHASYPAIVALVLFAAFTKSAQVPFHFWLPGAMAAPTPVSAYLHSATMVKAGVFLVARLQPELGGTELWHLSLAIPGALTMFLGAAMAYGARDLKAVLAYTTVSGLGTLMLMLGIGTKESEKAALVFLVVHALYKGALFMVAGIVDHATGTRDLERLRGLRRALPLTTLCAFLGALSMMGLPPLFGFIGKELLYEAKLGAPGAPWIPTVFGVGANVLIVATALMIGRTPFAGPAAEAPPILHRPHYKLLIGPLALALSGLLIGVLPGVFAQPFVQAALEAVRPETTVVELSLWHGINPILLLSIATLLAGFALYALRPRVLRVVAPLAALGRFGPGCAYEAALRGLVRVASWQTRLLQHGRLRTYVATAALVALALALAPAFGGRPAFDGRLDFRAHELLLALSIAGAAAAGCRARSRLTAVLTLGAVGLSMSLFFLGLGAPDLALTQVAVETLTVVLFVLVLRRLPELRPLSSAGSRRADALFACAVGAAVALAVRGVLALEPRRELAEWLARESYPGGKGRNVVNVILVDFRALDTLGEIVVLGLAAIGVAGLLARRGEEERA